MGKSDTNATSDHSDQKKSKMAELDNQSECKRSSLAWIPSMTDLLLVCPHRKTVEIR